MVQGLPDWTKGIAVNVTAESAEYPTVIGTRPMGTTIVHNTVTPVNAWDEIVVYTPPAGYRFYLAKTTVYTIADVSQTFLRIKLDNMIIGGGHTCDWCHWDMDFPFGVYIDGDGTKKVAIEVKWGGFAEEWEATIFGELVEI